ncbi:MAG: LysR family transcriptional regulator [Myxococcota bacterium]
MTDELRHFLLICDHGTFTAASRHAHLSQPALTASIQRLEHQVGAVLFHRGPRGAVPTAAGEVLRPFAEAALGAIEQGRRAVRAIATLEHGEVRIGAGAMACGYLLPERLTAFRSQHPGIELQLRELVASKVERRVETGHLDLGIVANSPVAEAWGEDLLVLVSAPHHPPPAAHVTFFPGANHRAILDDQFPEVPVAMELNSLEAVKAHVMAGMGIALLSYTAVEGELKRGRLVEVIDARTPVVRKLGLLHAGDARLSPAARALRDHLLAHPPTVAYESRSPVRKG